jgi:hypothetical protein
VRGGRSEPLGASPGEIAFVDLLERLAEKLGVSIAEFFVQPKRGAAEQKPLRKGRRPRFCSAECLASRRRAP